MIDLVEHDIRVDAREMRMAGHGWLFVWIVRQWLALRCAIPVVVEGVWAGLVRILPVLRVLHGLRPAKRDGGGQEPRH